MSHSRLDVFNKKLMFLDDHVRAIEKKLDMLSMNRVDSDLRNDRRPSRNIAFQSNIQMARRVQSMQERGREESTDVISLYGDENRISKHRISKNLNFEDEEPGFEPVRASVPFKPKPDVDILA